jgi:hypothetical protein
MGTSACGGSVSPVARRGSGQRGRPGWEPRVRAPRRTMGPCARVRSFVKNASACRVESRPPSSCRLPRMSAVSRAAPNRHTAAALTGGLRGVVHSARTCAVEYGESSQAARLLPPVVPAWLVLPPVARSLLQASELANLRNERRRGATFPAPLRWLIDSGWSPPSLRNSSP